MAQVKLSREQLHELVWSSPIHRLAPQYGLSGVGFSKVCRALGIPRPARGYWARLAAGHKLKRKPLPPREPHQGEYAWFEHRNAPVQAPSGPAPEVPVPTDLADAHPSVGQLAGALARARADKHGLLLVPGAELPVIAVTVETHRRALLILAALCAALELRGHHVSFVSRRDGEKHSRVLETDVDGEKIEMCIAERLLPVEQDFADRQQTEREYVASGRLGIDLRLTAIRGRAGWSDGQARPLEKWLGRIVLTIEAESKARKAVREEKRLEQEEAVRRHLAQEAAAKQAQLQRDLERYRVSLLDDLKKMAHEWSVAVQLRTFLHAVEVGVPESDRAHFFVEWLQWARSAAEKIDPLSAPAKIAKPLRPGGSE